MRSPAVHPLPSLLLALAFTCSAAGAQEVVMVDRIVAVVDADPIFLSDVEWFKVLGRLEQQPGESDRAFGRRSLEWLIDHRLRFHEVDRHGLLAVPAEVIEARVEALGERFGGERGLAARLAEAGLDGDLLRYLLSRQLRVNAYIEERLRPRVFVDLEDVRAYYESELATEMARRGEALPPLPEVRESIRALLRERRLNREIETWTAELRAKADVVDLYDRPAGSLPPVAERVGG